MSMQQCPNGHLYDDSKNKTCPYCGGSASVNVTAPVSPQHMTPVNPFPPTMPLEDNFVSPHPPAENSPDSFPPTEPVEREFVQTTYKEDIINDNGVTKVRGWLVCTNGDHCGLDFKIHGEKNSIGRGNTNDIKIDFDSSVSKGVNANISYDVRNNKFYIFQGIESKNNIYVNDQMLMMPIELKDYDVIEIGNTKLLFRSLCNEQFNWEKSEQE